MAIHYRSDRSNQPIPHEECSALRLAGPLKHMLGRGTVHVTKAEGAALARWFGVEVHRPELETVPGPEDVPHERFGAMPDALVVSPLDRVKAIETGSEANSAPPKGRRKSAS